MLIGWVWGFSHDFHNELILSFFLLSFLPSLFIYLLLVYQWSFLTAWLIDCLCLNKFINQLLFLYQMLLVWFFQVHNGFSSLCDYVTSSSSVCLFVCIGVSPSLWVVCGPAAFSSLSSGGAREWRVGVQAWYWGTGGSYFLICSPPTPFSLHFLPSCLLWAHKEHNVPTHQCWC